MTVQNGSVRQENPILVDGASTTTRLYVISDGHYLVRYRASSCHPQLNVWRLVVESTVSPGRGSLFLLFTEPSLMNPQCKR